MAKRGAKETDRERLQKEANLQISLFYTETDEHGNFLHPPGASALHLPENHPERIKIENDELYEFIDAAYGVAFPRKTITKNHRAPFDFIADLFFQRIKNAIGFANRNGGKALALTTPILTAAGWSTMGDLKVGDYVFSADGTPTRVEWCSEVFIGNQCYAVEFDSETIIADADHLWEVIRSKQTTPKILTTKQLFEDLQKPLNIGYKTRWHVLPCKPLQMDEVELPIPPYVMGACLSYGGIIFSWDFGIVEELRKHWPTLIEGLSDTHRHVLPGLFKALNSLNLLKSCSKDGETKTIFSEYLLNSIDNRLLFLQGLMDTDGCADSSKSRIEFCSTIHNLASGVKFLLQSFGHIVALDKNESWCKFDKSTWIQGKDHYLVRCRPLKHCNVFKLARKRKAVIPAKNSVVHKLVSIRPVDSVATRCIKVTHPSSLFLCGTALIPTHNTYSVAILNHLDAFFKHGCEVASAGAVLDQAAKCYRYFQGFRDAEWFQRFCQKWEERTGRPFVTKDIQSWTEWDNGSTVAVITGSEKGLRSPHPHKARIDEIDLMEWSILQTGLSMAHSSNGIRGQNVFTSTRQRQDGSMNKLLSTAAEKGIEIYEWNVWEVIEKCDRHCFDDPKFGTCPIYGYCKGKAHACDGFYKTDDFIDKVRLIDKDSFATEWENSKPSKHRLVYNMFEASKHIMTPAKLSKMFSCTKPQMSWTRFGGLDFGSSPGHPFVYLQIFELPNGAYLVYHEYTAEQRLLRDHAISIKGNPYFTESERIYADHDRQDALELKNYGVKTIPAAKDVLPGIDLVKTLMSGFPPDHEPRIYIWWECKATIREFSAYSWRIKADGTPATTENPEKDYDHCMDALRYGVFTKKRRSNFNYQLGTLRSS